MTPPAHDDARSPLGSGVALAPPAESPTATAAPRGGSSSPSGCLLCGGTSRFWFARGDRHYERCGVCGLLVVPQGVATDASGVSIYESETSVFLADGNTGYYFDHETNLANSRRKLALVEEHVTDGSSLMDAGANFGHFLSVAAGRYRARGFDLSPAAVAWGRAHFGVDAVVGSVYSPPPDGAPWDAITSWDVLEHLADPEAALFRLRELLRPRGWLFLSTPDAGSRIARLLGRRWHYLDPVQHVTLFSRESLRTLLERSGFDVVAARSLGHDYRLRYVADRLCYLHSRGATGALLRAARLLLRPLGGFTVYLNLGDVVAVAARRRE
ncbi:MAG TPA: class I SAM-dependent methyltransferase [Vicinamibacteria bacterium]|nr:class I SAM-dependent methyltransferase [Vicinamibacteria bacterium]